MCGYDNEMAVGGKPLYDNDVISYILNGHKQPTPSIQGLKG
jgi:hypothetical protein